MQVNEIIEYTNAVGVTYRFIGLVSVEGLGDVEADIQQQSAPFQDGSTYIDAMLAPRYVGIEFIIRGTDYADIRSKRSAIGSKLNPKLGLGTLRYISGTTTRVIDAIAESVPFYPDGDARGERWQRGTLTFVCPNPYWRSLDVIEEPTFKPLFQFPFEGVFEMGEQRDERIITNQGDAPAPLYIEFYGPAVNPVITNTTTAEYIRVNQTLAEGDFMRIDTTDGRKSVEFVAPDGTATNVFNWIDLGSTFFKLAVGDNEIAYSADSDIQGAIVNITYSNRYTAV